MDNQSPRSPRGALGNSREGCPEVIPVPHRPSLRAASGGLFLFPHTQVVLSGRQTALLPDELSWLQVCAEDIWAGWSQRLPGRPLREPDTGSKTSILLDLIDPSDYLCPPSKPIHQLQGEHRHPSVTLSGEKAHGR